MKLFRFIEDKPLSPWGYVLYSLLFCVPVIGFIFLLIFALGSGNQHRKNFARSWLIAYIVFIISSAIVGILTIVGVLSFALPALI